MVDHPPSPVRPALCVIPAGTFTLGSPPDEVGRAADEGPHRVTLTRPFLMMQTPVTLGHWRALLGSTPSRFTRDAALPVEQVNWYEAVAFANALSESEGLPPAYVVQGASGTLGGGLPRGTAHGLGDFAYASVAEKVSESNGLPRLSATPASLRPLLRPPQRVPSASVHGVAPETTGYRLPTEAEWEYACRAGTAGALYAGPWALRGESDAPALDPLAWYAGNSGVDHPEGVESKWKAMQYPAPRSATHPVGQKQPNPWGLHDMLGNVWEWTDDWYGAYGATGHPPELGEIDPTGPPRGRDRVVRGGSWFAVARLNRAAARLRRDPAFRSSYQGFRLVRDL